MEMLKCHITSFLHYTGTEAQVSEADISAAKTISIIIYSSSMSGMYSITLNNQTTNKKNGDGNLEQ